MSNQPKDTPAMDFEQRAALLQAMIATVEHMKFLNMMSGLEKAGKNDVFQLASGDGETNLMEAAKRLYELVTHFIPDPMFRMFRVDDEFETREDDPCRDWGDCDE